MNHNFCNLVWFNIPTYPITQNSIKQFLLYYHHNVYITILAVEADLKNHARRGKSKEWKMRTCSSHGTCEARRWWRGCSILARRHPFCFSNRIECNQCTCIFIDLTHQLSNLFSCSSANFSALIAVASCPTLHQLALLADSLQLPTVAIATDIACSDFAASGNHFDDGRRNSINSASILTFSFNALHQWNHCWAHQRKL